MTPMNHCLSTACRWAAAPVAAAAALALASCGGGDLDDEQICADRANDTNARLLKCVTLGAVRDHQEELQRIADANGGQRSAATPGYDASADYAERVLRDAGYAVTRQVFQFRTFVETTPTVLEQVSPAPAAAIENTVMSYSGSGSVQAEVAAPTVATGCDAADFAAFPAGRIALISRGSCTFAIKATNAAAAGAAGAVIYNNVDGPLGGTLGDTFALDLPVTGVTQAVGQQLAATAGLTLRLVTDTVRREDTTSNVLAESVDGDPDNVVMVGAHLDSVAEGPGINDNGSGTAAVLETAVQMKRVSPVNKVRFALWGAEEANLVGSTYYVNNLAAEERDRIALYLNFDMIGSPNAVYFIYDGDDSDGEGAGPGPEGSDTIEQVFQAYYDERRLPHKGTDFDSRSDYAPFVNAGIPAGGLFTGAEGMKTEEEAALWGGTAGEAYDPCYHQACDTLDNVDRKALEANADAVAHATLTFAMGEATLSRAARLALRESKQAYVPFKAKGPKLPRPTE